MGKFIVDLNTIKVLKKKDLGKEEPLLWLFGIAIDLSAGSSSDPTRFILKNLPTPGNLGGSFKKGESRAIPNSVGQVEKEVKPVLGMLALGFIVMAWDHDKTPTSAVQAAYRDAAQVINDFVQERVTALNTDPLSSAEIKVLKGAIEEHIRERFKASVTLKRPGTLNQDDFVGMDYRFFTPDPATAQSENLAMRFTARSVDYQVTGVMQYTP